MQDTITEPLLAIDDYARQEQVSRRTINRYVKVGRLQARKIKGRTFIVDMPIEPAIVQPASAPETQDRTDRTVQVPGTSHLAIPVKNDWIAFGAAQAYAKSRHKWQVAFFVVAVLLIIVLVVGAGAGVWFYQENISLRSRLL